MKDTTAVGRKIAIAITALPLGFAPALSGCADDIDYATSADASENNGSGPGNNGTEAENNGSGPDNNGSGPGNNGTDPQNNGSGPQNNGSGPGNNGVVPVNNNVSPNNNGSANNSNTVKTCEEARASGDFELDGSDDGCGNPFGTWELPIEDALRLGAEPCGDTWSESSGTDCPATMTLSWIEDSDWEDYRNQELYLELADYSPDACVYKWIVNWGCEGRALADGDLHLTAPPVPGGRWGAAMGLGAAIAGLPPAWRALIGDAWLEDARHEHASIASFARVTLELMHFAAPPALLKEAQQAGLDEVEHARGCFELAGLYRGAPVDPGPLTSPSPRYTDLIDLAVTTFEEGAVGETVATLAATRAAGLAQIKDVRDLLQRIADEEARHAALAWSTLRWAVEVGGDGVREALSAAASDLRPGDDAEPAPALPAPVTAVLNAHGRLAPMDMQRCERDAWTSVILPILQDVLS